MTETATGCAPEGQPADPIDDVRSVALRGDVGAALGLSGAVVVDDYLVLGADEGHRLQILSRAADGQGWAAASSVALADGDQEVDIEAITFGDGCLYVVGSHSFRRRRMKKDLSSRKNLERFLTIDHQGSRNRLYRLRFNAADGSIGKPDRIDLSKRLAKDRLLGSFFGLPSKENGIDIEGLAFHGGQLYIGFRGPVLRENFVPVMVLPFDHPKRYRLGFVRLEGQGIRDLVALGDGFLIVSGPVNDAPGPYRLWWWDGEDQIPGKDRKIVPSRLLGEISTPGGARAEGLAVLGRDGDRVDVLLVYETAHQAQAVSMRVTLPA